MASARVWIAAWAALVAAGAPCAAQERSREGLVEVARRDGAFQTLVAAVEAAGLGDALSGEGHFTLFAPTDEAFRALPEGALDALLRHPPSLRRVLEGHVGRGARRAAEVVEYEAVTTLAGTRLPISSAGGEVRIGGARVVRADLLARNGVIHAIDRVLLPAPAAPAPTLLALAAGVDDLSTLVAAARAAGLEGALGGRGPLTVFAPSNAAFAALPAGALEALLRDPERLRRILLHHVVEGELRAEAVGGRRTLTTLAGTTLDVDARGPGVVIGGARVVAADLAASNGVAHRIDRLLLPPPADAAPAPTGYDLQRYQPERPARHVMKKTVRGAMGRVERTELVREVGRGEAGVLRIVDSEGEYQDFVTGGAAMAGQSMTSQGFVQRYEPALRLFPAVARTGEAETYEAAVIHRAGRRETRGTVARVVVLEGVEDVETPAGRFTGCLRFRVEQRNQPDSGASFVAETRETVWLAPAVGEVRSVATTSLRSGGVPWLTAEVTLELASRAP